MYCLTKYNTPTEFGLECKYIRVAVGISYPTTAVRAASPISGRGNDTYLHEGSIVACGNDLMEENSHEEEPTWR